MSVIRHAAGVCREVRPPLARPDAPDWPVVFFDVTANGDRAMPATIAHQLAQHGHPGQRCQPSHRAPVVATRRAQATCARSAHGAAESFLSIMPHRMIIFIRHDRLGAPAPFPGRWWSRANDHLRASPARATYQMASRHVLGPTPIARHTRNELARYTAPRHGHQRSSPTVCSRPRRASGVDGLAAIDDERVAGDKRGLVGGQEQDAVGDLLGARQALYTAV